MSRHIEQADRTSRKRMRLTLDDDGRKKLWRIIVSSILLVIAFVIQHLTVLPLLLQLVIFLPAYIIVGYDVLAEASESLVHGHPFDEDFLMSIATIGALLIGFVPGGTPMFAEAVFVMLFFQVGELFEDIAEGNSKKAISQLPDSDEHEVSVIREVEETKVVADSVIVGDTMIVAPGERLLLDGIVTDGTSEIDMSSLTGESLPVSIKTGDEVSAGGVNLTGVVHVRATHTSSDSTIARMRRLIEEGERRKSSSERFITRFARVYTPIVVALAVIVAIIPSIITGNVST